MVFGSCQRGKREEQDRRDRGPGAGTDRGPGPRPRTIRPVKVQDRGTPSFGATSVSHFMNPLPSQPKKKKDGIRLAKGLNETKVDVASLVRTVAVRGQASPGYLS